MSAWMIRAGHGGVYAEDWLDKGKIGIGWDFGSKDIASMKREQIRATYLAEHPNESKNRVAAIVSQVYRFAHEMTQGQTVVMYDPASRLYHIGVITGDCVPTRDEDDPAYTRTVRWDTSASRDALKQSSKNSLGGIQTIFAVSTTHQSVSPYTRVRIQTNEGSYFNSGSKDTGVPPSKPPTYPTHHVPRFNDKL